MHQLEIEPQLSDGHTTRQTSRSKLRRWAILFGTYAGIIVVTLMLLDLALIALGLFPPTARPGDARVGWVAATPTGEIRNVRCLDLTADTQVTYVRNEQGMRTDKSARLLREDDQLFKVMVSGDSHTDLCVPNQQTHFGVLERELNVQGIRSATMAFGAGMYSPLQAYLAVKDLIPEYTADALVLNLYTGNDFYDMLRIDDRPHFVLEGDHYRIASPVWYSYDAPDKLPRSRVLFAMRTLAQKTGLHDIFLRLDYLRAVAAREDVGPLGVLKYMNEVRKTGNSNVKYSHAFAAQMLNQQLFFHHFPDSKHESIRRVKALLQMIRRENPNVLLVLSPIPSYELAQRGAVAPALVEVLDRLSITHEGGKTEERALYEALRTAAAESGWLFIDTLPELSNYTGSEPLYNDADYHIRPVASEIIGRAQARGIQRYLTSRSTD